MESMTYVLFGATGDLAKRKIFPALYNLYLEQKLPNPFSIIGLGRNEMSHKEFQNHVVQSVKAFSRRMESDDKHMSSFLDVFRYSLLDATKADDFEKLLNLVKERETELNIPEN